VIAWYVNRLRNMSPVEILHRLDEQRKRVASRFARHDWPAFANPGPAPALPGAAAACRANTDDAMRAALAERVTEILAGRCVLHGVEWPTRSPDELFPQTIWLLDPVGGAAWPGAETYCFDIGYRRDAARGDVKFVWDFNRMQCLPPLALQAALSGDAACLAAIEAAVSSWHAANPPFRGVNWNSCIELAIRSISLLVVSSLCGESLSQACAAKLREILAAQYYWLRRFPSRHSSANNHRTYELLGILAIATAMPELDPAGAAATAARAEIERHALAQILPDGVGAEQAIAYAAFTAEALLVADFIAQASGRPFGPALQERLAAFGEYCAWLVDDAGRVPAIGDDDSGPLLPDFAERPYVASIANVIAARCGRGAFAPSVGPGGLREALLGIPGAASAPRQGLRCFKTGGYTVVRETRAGQRLRLVVDHGPLGYLSIAAHGHADALAFTLSLDGTEILVDPGTYLYHAGIGWRDWFRSTSAHNTLTIEGADQSVMSGDFNWSHKANCTLESVDGSENWSVAAQCDGYLARYGVRHVRRIRALPGGVEIVDLLRPANPTLVATAQFQFAPDLVLEPDGSAFRILRAGEAIARISFEPAGETTRSCGEDRLDGGWVSPQFGEKHAAERLVWRGVIPETGLGTRIVWG